MFEDCGWQLLLVFVGLSGRRETEQCLKMPRSPLMDLSSPLLVL